MAERAQMPTEIRREGVHAVRIAWADGHQSEYRNDYLRDHCPCAECRSRPKRSLPVLNARRDDLYPVQIGLVGRYALSVQWSDGHDTGIYSYETLRALCPCEGCRPAGVDASAS
jgi:DUF971 family protein